MASDDEPTVGNPASRKRSNASAQPRPVISLRVRADLQKLLKTTAEVDGLALSEEIERRLLKSFEDQATIDGLRDHISSLNRAQFLLNRDPASKAICDAFAMTLAAAEQHLGTYWREDPAVVRVVTNVTRRMMMRKVRPSKIIAGVGVDERVPVAMQAITPRLSEYLNDEIWPLPEPPPAENSDNWTNRARMVAIIREKDSDKILAEVTSADFDTTDPEDRPNLGPDIRSAIERLQTNDDRILVEDYTVYIKMDGETVWESVAQPRKRFILRLGTPVELAIIACEQDQPATGLAAQPLCENNAEALVAVEVPVQASVATSAISVKDPVEILPYLVKPRPLP